MNRVSVNACARCGLDMIAPEWSGHVSDRCVRNVWSCAGTTARQARRIAANIAKLPELLRTVIGQLEFRRRARLRRPSSLRLTRPPRGEISQRFRYLRDLPPAFSEYSPQLTQRSRQRPAAHEKNHEPPRDY